MAEQFDSTGDKLSQFYRFRSRRHPSLYLTIFNYKEGVYAVVKKRQEGYLQYFRLNKYDRHLEIMANALIIDVDQRLRAEGTKLITWPKRNQDATNQMWNYDPESGCLACEMHDLVIDIPILEDGQEQNLGDDHIFVKMTERNPDINQGWDIEVSPIRHREALGFIRMRDGVTWICGSMPLLDAVTSIWQEDTPEGYDVDGESKMLKCLGTSPVHAKLTEDGHSVKWVELKEDCAVGFEQDLQDPVQTLSGSFEQPYHWEMSDDGVVGAFINVKNTNYWILTCNFKDFGHDQKILGIFSQTSCSHQGDLDNQTVKCRNYFDTNHKIELKHSNAKISRTVKGCWTAGHRWVFLAEVPDSQITFDSAQTKSSNVKKKSDASSSSNSNDISRHSQSDSSISRNQDPAKKDDKGGKKGCAIS